MKKLVGLGLGLGLCACAPVAAEHIGDAMTDAGSVLVDAGAWVADSGAAHSQERLGAPCSIAYEWVETAATGWEVRTQAHFAFMPGSEGSTDADLLGVSAVACDWSGAPDAPCPDGSTCSGSRAPRAQCLTMAPVLIDGHIAVQCGTTATNEHASHGGAYARAVFERR